MCRSGVLLEGKQVVEVRYTPLGLRSFVAASPGQQNKAISEMLNKQNEGLVAIDGTTQAGEAFIQQIRSLSEELAWEGPSVGKWKPYVAEALAAYSMALQMLGDRRIDTETDNKPICRLLENDMGWRRMPGKAERAGYFFLDLTREIPLPSYLKA